MVYRAKFVPTMFAARQFVSHGHVKLNGRRVTIPSIRLKARRHHRAHGKAKDMAVVLEATQLLKRDVPDYVEAQSLQHGPPAGARSRASRTFPIGEDGTQLSSSNTIRAKSGALACLASRRLDCRRLFRA